MDGAIDKQVMMMLSSQLYSVGSILSVRVPPWGLSTVPLSGANGC